MSLRISDAACALRARASSPLNPAAPVLAAVLLLGACGGPKPDDAAVTRAETAKRAAAGTVPCARGAGALVRVCTLARERTAEGEVLTISYPDGGFRRLLVPTGGQAIVAADGAEPAVVTVLSDGRVDVKIGTDHVRLPARLAPSPSS